VGGELLLSADAVADFKPPGLISTIGANLSVCGCSLIGAGIREIAVRISSSIPKVGASEPISLLWPDERVSVLPDEISGAHDIGGSEAIAKGSM
jgi:hypothetical protein